MWTVSKKYQDLFHKLKVKFGNTRSEGHHVDFNWLWSNGQKIYKEQLNDEQAVLRKHLIENFIKQKHLKRRKIQQNKQLPKEHYRGKI